MTHVVWSFVKVFFVPHNLVRQGYSAGKFCVGQNFYNIDYTLPYKEVPTKFFVKLEEVIISIKFSKQLMCVLLALKAFLSCSGIYYL